MNWEAKNAALAFHVRKLYELFRTGDMAKLKQQLVKSPVPSPQLKEVRVFIAEVNTSVTRGLAKEKLAELNVLLATTKKVIRRKSVVKKSVPTHFSPSKQLEQRLGIALLPQLDTHHAQLFVSLLSKKIAPHLWLAFWKQAVPRFEKFAEEIQQAPRKEAFDALKIKKVFMQTKRSVLEAFAPLAKNNPAVPGYTAVITALGQSAWQVLLDSKYRAGEVVTADPVVEMVSKESVVTLDGVLEQLYDDGVFLQVRYRLVATKERCTVVFEQNSLVVGFEPGSFLDMKLFGGLSSHQQQRVLSAVETLYVYGRMLESAERGSDVAHGLKGLLKQCVAEFSLTYGKNLLKIRG